MKQSFYPFSGKTPEDIRLIVSGNDVTKFTKVFYANFGQVFDAIELEQANSGMDFYVMTREKQWSLIEAKVNEIITQVEAEEPEEPELPPMESTPEI